MGLARAIEKKNLERNWLALDKRYSFGDISFVPRHSPAKFSLVHPEFAEELSHPALCELASSVSRATIKRRTGAEIRISRGSVQRIVLGSGRSIFVRQYLRGGLVSKIIKSLFFANPLADSQSLRPVHELRVLAELLAAEVHVPCPVACVVEYLGWKGTYRGYILTAEIPHGCNLLEVPECASSVMTKVGVQAGKALSAGVCHADFHLGNIILNDLGEVYLLDFDKAKFVDERDRFLGARELTARLERSIRKHKLPAELLTLFRSGLSAERDFTDNSL